MEPINRAEKYLDAIANRENSADLPNPINREERFLKAILDSVENGSGGGSYVLPVASQSRLGGVKGPDKTEGETKQVHIDPNGNMWVASGNCEQEQSDWDENDETSTTFIKNKPIVEETRTISRMKEEYDESDVFQLFDGYVSLARMSDTALTKSQLIGATLKVIWNEDVGELTFSEKDIIDLGSVIIVELEGIPYCFSLLSPIEGAPAGLYIPAFDAALAEYMSITYSVRGIHTVWKLIEGSPFGAIEHSVKVDPNADDAQTVTINFGDDITVSYRRAIAPEYFTLPLNEMLPINATVELVENGEQEILSVIYRYVNNEMDNSGKELVRISDQVYLFTLGVPIAFYVESVKAVTINGSLFDAEGQITFPYGGFYIIDADSTMPFLGMSLNAEVRWTETRKIASEYLSAPTLTAPNGTKYRLTVDDDGNLSTEEVV